MAIKITCDLFYKAVYSVRTTKAFYTELNHENSDHGEMTVFEHDNSINGVLISTFLTSQNESFHYLKKLHT